MKKMIIIFFAASLCWLAANAQTKPGSLKMTDSLNKIDSLKRLDTIKMSEPGGAKYSTGHLQDVLANYLQIAAKNITSTDNSFTLRVNWFALNPMDSVDKYNNVNFLQTAWQRNGEFLASVGLNKGSKVNSWSAGINYNLLQRRDVSTHYFTDAYINAFRQEAIILNNTTDSYFEQVSLIIVPKMIAVCTPIQHDKISFAVLKDELNSALPGMFQGKQRDDDVLKVLQDQMKNDMGLHLIDGELSPAMLKLIKSVADFEAREAINDPLSEYIRTSGKTKLIFAEFMTPSLKKAIVDFLNTQVKNNAVLHGQLGANTLTEANDKVITNYGQLLKYVGRQPLLTFGYLYTHGTGTVLSSHVAGFTYLQGLGKLRSDKTGQLKISLTDTLSGNDPSGMVRNFKRNIIAFQAGYNRVLAVQKKLSVMELNIAAEGDWATNGYVKNTDRTRIYFDAYFRARLPSTPWVKLDLKYDPKDGNVFGLLNFTYNLDR